MYVYILLGVALKLFAIATYTLTQWSKNLINFNLISVAPNIHQVVVYFYSLIYTHMYVYIYLQYLYAQTLRYPPTNKLAWVCVWAFIIINMPLFMSIFTLVCTMRLLVVIQLTVKLIYLFADYLSCCLLFRDNGQILPDFIFIFSNLIYLYYY